MDVIMQYKLGCLIISFLVCVVCGLLKLPLIKALRKKLTADGTAYYTEKQIKKYVTDYCTLISLILATFGILLLYYGTVGIKDSAAIIGDITLTMTLTQIWYAVYEGNYNNGQGKFSIKTYVYVAMQKMKEHKQVPQEIKDIANIVQNVLVEQIKLPMTDVQIENLEKALKEKL